MRFDVLVRCVCVEYFLYKLLAEAVSYTSSLYRTQKVSNSKSGITANQRLRHNASTARAQLSASRGECKSPQNQATRSIPETGRKRPCARRARPARWTRQACWARRRDVPQQVLDCACADSPHARVATHAAAGARLCGLYFPGSTWIINKEPERGSTTTQFPRPMALSATTAGRTARTT